MDQKHSSIPQPIACRLLVNFLGWWLRAGARGRGNQFCLNEELVDRMDPETWDACRSPCYGALSHSQALQAISPGHDSRNGSRACEWCRW